MPKYRTRMRERERTDLPARMEANVEKTRKYKKRLPKDTLKLLRWAGLGSRKDYTKLQELAKKARAGLPSYIDGVAVELLMRVDKQMLIEQIQASENHDVSAGAFLDAINWILDKVPYGSWVWPVKASQSAINAQKGDGLNEVDEQYARLVGATYGKIEDRPFILDHWRRQTQFDSDYISVFDNPDGHRLIAVRGTQGTGTDIAEDILVGITGRSTNLIGGELLQILAATPQATVVDLAAHSLGTSLALQAYVKNKQVKDAIHETYLYNPAYSPLLKGTADAFERDVNVRYFVNFNDPISMGGLGHRAPRNVVYRSTGGPISAHKLAQWEGSGVHTPQYHAPPETRVHAHKAWFGDRVQERPFEDQLTDGQYLLGRSRVLGVYDKEHPEPEDVQQDLGAVRELDAGPTFDFGVEEPYPYALL